MDNRLIFLYFVEIAQGCSMRVLPASFPFGENVSEKGLLPPRSGVTEREDQSVCIDCTWKARGVDPGR